jgi:hypothetical protein
MNGMNTDKRRKMNQRMAISERMGRAGGEVLGRLHEDSQEEHREACHKAPAAIPESGHW